MTLDKMILREQETAEELRLKAKYIDDSDYPNVISARADCIKYAEYHEQVSKYLIELKAYKECGCIKDECFNCGGCDNGR